MKQFLVALALVAALFTPAPAHAQSKQAMIEIAKTCPVAFNSDGTFKNAPVSDPFRRSVIPYIAAKMNERDGANNWGVLYRMDRQDETPEPGRLTTDVVIDRRTRIHYDVLSDNSVSWGTIGPLPNEKDWFIQDPSQHATICPGGVTPPPPPPVDPPFDPAPLNARIDDLYNRIAAQSAVIAAQNEELGQLRSQLARVDELSAIATGADAKAEGVKNFLKSRPIPDGCSVVLLGCRLTFNAPNIE